MTESNRVAGRTAGEVEDDAAGVGALSTGATFAWVAVTFGWASTFSALPSIGGGGVFTPWQVDRLVLMIGAAMVVWCAVTRHGAPRALRPVMLACVALQIVQFAWATLKWGLLVPGVVEAVLRGLVTARLPWTILLVVTCVLAWRLPVGAEPAFEPTRPSGDGESAASKPFGARPAGVAMRFGLATPLLAAATLMAVATFGVRGGMQGILIVPMLASAVLGGLLLIVRRGVWVALLAVPSALILAVLLFLMQVAGVGMFAK